MDLPLDDLYNLIYSSFPALEHTTTFLSVHPYDTALRHRVRKIPLDLGLKLLQADAADKPLFYIELFPSHGWAELWARDAWDESLTKYLKAKAQRLESDPAYKLQQQIQNLEYRITHYFIQVTHVERTLADAVAKSLIRTDITLEETKLPLSPELTAELIQLKQTLSCQPSARAPSTAQ